MTTKLIHTPAPRASRGDVLLDALLFLSFFISGCSALIYQVCWQRSLYGVIGVDMDSITIIVSVFMLGIGIGGMLGGWLADRHPAQRIKLYAFAELGIALYGLSTLWTLTWLDVFLAQLGWGGGGLSAVACFVFLIVPTTLMGMTLPILTMALNERRVNIGVSVGTLYFVNTLGAAAGAVLVPLVLFPMLTLPHVVALAVVGNLVVAACAVLAGSRLMVEKAPA
ncbi:MAG: hypothetical protein EOO38_15090 [Cytophagaceae bacterium]|nr:MAG: hypothetical protein EOO38_15090 [Cytophagaceae bacterium]